MIKRNNVLLRSKLHVDKIHIIKQEQTVHKWRNNNEEKYNAVLDNLITC